MMFEFWGDLRKLLKLSSPDDDFYRVSLRLNGLYLQALLTKSRYRGAISIFLFAFKLASWPPGSSEATIMTHACLTVINDAVKGGRSNGRVTSLNSPENQFHLRFELMPATV